MQTTICHPYHFIPTVAERKATISGVAEPLNYQKHQFPLVLKLQYTHPHHKGDIIREGIFKQRNNGRVILNYNQFVHLVVVDSASIYLTRFVVYFAQPSQKFHFDHCSTLIS